MDKMKGLAKGGWHPNGDRAIHRDTWKSDLKGVATGKKKDPYEEQRNHTSAPLSSLRDPDSFGPPPKRTGYGTPTDEAISRTGAASNSGGAMPPPAETRGTSGWGSSAVETGYSQRKSAQEEEERRRMHDVEQGQKKESGPWRVDSSGLRTDNLPAPPVRRGMPGATSSSTAGPRTASPSLPPRGQQTGIVTNSPSGQPNNLPPRQTPKQAGPPPVLPPRQNEYPDEHTPAPPPPYSEALTQPQPPHNPAQINQGSATRLGQAGISVPGLGIGRENASMSPPPPSIQGPPQGQLSELQQRFAKMNAGSKDEASTGTIAQKKPPPPPPPPKKAALSMSSETTASQPRFASGSSEAPAPPPVPLGSKPKP